MKDTKEASIKKYFDMIMQRSGEERLLMGCSMYETSRQIVKSSILEKNPDLSSKEISKEIFDRFYGLDFSKEQKEKINRIWN